MLDIANDIQSLMTFRRRSGDFMKRPKKSKRPLVLTVKGKAAAVVQDAEALKDFGTYQFEWWAVDLVGADSGNTLSFDGYI